MEPMGNLSYSIAVKIFHEQAKGLKTGGANLAWIETISSAAEGVHRADMPWSGTMSFDTAGRTMMRLTAPELVRRIQKMPNQPMAFGANCGVGHQTYFELFWAFRRQKLLCQ